MGTFSMLHKVAQVYSLILAFEKFISGNIPQVRRESSMISS